MVMARELYTLLTGQHNPFHVSIDPGVVAIYTRPVITGKQVDLLPLSRTEQTTIDTQFARQKHYFLSLQNIKRACFTVFDVSINNAFKVSTDPTIRGWHAGMSVQDILDQLSSIYGQPTPAAMEINDAAFRGVYLAADAPAVLFWPAAIHTLIVNSCRMQFPSSSQWDLMLGHLKNGIAYSPWRRHGLH